MTSLHRLIDQTVVDILPVGWANVDESRWTTLEIETPAGVECCFGQKNARSGYAVNQSGAKFLDGEITYRQRLISVGTHASAIGAGARFDFSGKYGYLATVTPLDGKLQINLFRVDSGSASFVADTVHHTPPAELYVDGAVILARIAIYGETICAKFWIENEPEPNDWQLQTRDAMYSAPGYVALYSCRDNSMQTIGVSDLILNYAVTSINPSFDIDPIELPFSSDYIKIKGNYTGYAPHGLLYTFDSGFPTHRVDHLVAFGGRWSGYIPRGDAGPKILTLAYSQTPNCIAAANVLVTPAREPTYLPPVATPSPVMDLSPDSEVVIPITEPKPQPELATFQIPLVAGLLEAIEAVQKAQTPEELLAPAKILAEFNLQPTDIRAFQHSDAIPDKESPFSEDFAEATLGSDIAAEDSLFDKPVMDIEITGVPVKEPIFSGQPPKSPPSARLSVMPQLDPHKLPFRRSLIGTIVNCLRGGPKF